MNNSELEQYLNNGLEHIINGIVKATLKNPKESLFMISHAAIHKKAARLRSEAQRNGTHIPAFLIASISNQCNLHCKGCFARANNNCSDDAGQSGIMTESDWNRVFGQAESMGIEFVILVGGEPLVRRDVIISASSHGKIIFPIFTNGTMMTDDYISVFKNSPNLLPIISLEGGAGTTDNRRGEGTYEIIHNAMRNLQENGIVYGASVTMTKDNLDEVLSDDFVSSMRKQGARGVIYIEYVPVNEATRSKSPDDESRVVIRSRIDELRKKYDDMLFVSFPGDEKESAGCLAAGRGFFHINAFGGAEPCPFSPYSDINLKNVSVSEALSSPLFRKLQSAGNLTDEHIGGCTLYEQHEQVASYVKE